MKNKIDWLILFSLIVVIASVASHELSEKKSTTMGRISVEVVQSQPAVQPGSPGHPVEFLPGEARSETKRIGLSWYESLAIAIASLFILGAIARTVKQVPLEPD